MTLAQSVKEDRAAATDRHAQDYSSTNQNSRQTNKRESMRSLLDEVETDKAREESDEITDSNHGSESKFEKSDGHEAFELKGKFSNAPKKTPSRKI
ncbi:hypothetical protein TNCV_3092981 [Trichonephila clavipes]|uniref:Uncharacterized protein n=1 Tax=Trichonephila clavipes TaxID=2585209 RepID=A0A8X6S6B1_TRICX|nr:hypothetical protein TNCV_3092981 [Trichonephila clavipes]